MKLTWRVSHDPIDRRTQKQMRWMLQKYQGSHGICKRRRHPDRHMGNSEGVSALDQLNLFDIPAVQIDETHWEIYDGSKLIGYFEVDKIGFVFKSCAGPMCGGGGPMYEGEEVIDFLNHAVVVLQRSYRQMREKKEETNWM